MAATTRDEGNHERWRKSMGEPRTANQTNDDRATNRSWPRSYFFLLKLRLACSWLLCRLPSLLNKWEQLDSLFTATCGLSSTDIEVLHGWTRVKSVVPYVKCNLLLGDWLTGRVDMAPDIINYRKRGSASCIVRQWLLWEGERERERRLWRHWYHAEIASHHAYDYLDGA